MEKVRVVHKDMLNTFVSAAALALAGVGDSFLYAYLPANCQSIGLPVFWVGVILSVNRFTRLFLNSYIAFFLSRYGLKNITLVAVTIAVITTLSYGFVNSVFLWLLVRILWGMSFSALRLNSMVYALQYKSKGIALGISRSVIESGAILALLIGPWFVSYFERDVTFALLGILSAASVLISMLLPEIEISRMERKDLQLSFPSSLNMMVMLNTFVVEGLLIVLLSSLLRSEYNFSATELLATTGLYLAYRRICLVLFSPFAGWLADRFGFHKVFNFTGLFVIVGIALVATGLTILGVIVAFSFGAMNASVAPGGAISGNSSLLKEVSDNVTWRDIGAAAGTLTGGFLLDFKYLHIIFWLSLIPLIACLLIQFQNSKKKTISHGIS
ncbi:MAG: hypothetical protein K0S32_1700 [Bacteroidetes bacterium]|jgi:MFS family permease|nr:hypothetical protein [Bacteroidota bacterium]